MRPDQHYDVGRGEVKRERSYVLGGPRLCDSRSRVLRCRPAGFEVGSECVQRAGWYDGAILRIIDINSFVDGGACGDVGEGEHFPAFRACSGSGGSAAGR
jgi:hypothetical protein